MKRWWKKWIALFLAILMLIWLISCAKNEVLTAQYGEELKPALETGFFTGNIWAGIR